MRTTVFNSNAPAQLSTVLSESTETFDCSQTQPAGLMFTAARAIVTLSATSAKVSMQLWLEEEVEETRRKIVQGDNWATVIRITELILRCQQWSRQWNSGYQLLILTTVLGEETTEFCSGILSPSPPPPPHPCHVLRRWAGECIAICFVFSEGVPRKRRMRSQAKVLSRCWLIEITLHREAELLFSKNSNSIMEARVETSAKRWPPEQQWRHWQGWRKGRKLKNSVSLSYAICTNSGNV